MTTNNITFSCNDQGAIDNYPPVPASKIIPEWYKDIPPLLKTVPGYLITDNIGSVKKCVPVLDYLTSGYIIRNTYQAELTRSTDNTFEGFKSSGIKPDHIGGQPHHQCPVSLNGHKHHYVKIHQPWLIKTPPGYSSLIYQPHYFFNKDYEILPAIVDTDKHTEAIALVSILHNDTIIQPGDPLVVVLPFKREDWKHSVKYEEFLSKSIFKLFLTKAWHGTYGKLFHSKKTYR
jgi:hypothetical protein